MAIQQITAEEGLARYGANLQHTIPHAVRRAWMERISRRKLAGRHLADAQRLFDLAAQANPPQPHLRYKGAKLHTLGTAMLEEADRTWVRALKDTFGSRLAYAVDEPTERSPEPAWTLWTWPAYKPERVVAYRLTRTLRMPAVKPKPGWKELEAEGRVLRGRNP